MDVRDVTRHRGELFRVLQQTDRGQTAVMTISPDENARLEETHHGDQSNPGRTPLFFVTTYAPPREY